MINIVWNYPKPSSVHFLISRLDWWQDPRDGWLSLISYDEINGPNDPAADEKKTCLFNKFKL